MKTTRKASSILKVSAPPVRPHYQPVVTSILNHINPCQLVGLFLIYFKALNVNPIRMAWSVVQLTITILICIITFLNNYSVHNHRLTEMDLPITYSFSHACLINCKLACLANTRRRPNAGCMLARCLQRRPNIDPALGQRPVFAEPMH